MRDCDTSAQASGEDVSSLRSRIEELERTAAELSAVRETLRQRESQLHQIIDLVPHLIFAKNAEGRFLLVNRAVAESYGTTVKDLTGRFQAEVHHDAEQVEAMLADDR